jgi:hypothetical protein
MQTQSEHSNQGANRRTGGYLLQGDRGGTDDHRNASIRRRPATGKLVSNSTAEHTSHAVCRDRASGDIFIGERAPYIKGEGHSRDFDFTREGIRMRLS